MGVFEDFALGFFRAFGRKKLFSRQPSDLKMWQASLALGFAPSCDCIQAQYDEMAWQELSLHVSC